MLSCSNFVQPPLTHIDGCGLIREPVAVSASSVDTAPVHQPYGVLSGRLTFGPLRAPKSSSHSQLHSAALYQA